MAAARRRRGGPAALRSRGMPGDSKILTPALIAHLKAGFRLDWHGDHGGRHWARVLRNGRLLAAKTGARLRVVELFAFLHDSQRHDEGSDREHGPRAAARDPATIRDAYARSTRDRPW